MQEQQIQPIKGIFSNKFNVNPTISKLKQSEQDFNSLLEKIKLQKQYRMAQFDQSISEIQIKQPFINEQPTSTNLSWKNNMFMSKNRYNQTSKTHKKNNSSMDYGDFGINKKCSMGINSRGNYSIKKIRNSMSEIGNLEVQDKKVKHVKLSEKQSIKLLNPQQSSTKQSINNSTPQMSNKKLTSMSRLSVAIEKSSNTKNTLNLSVHSKTLNMKGFTKVNNILNIEPQHFYQNILQENNLPLVNWIPLQWYEFYDRICKTYGVDMFQQPVIKKYRNCLYFGERSERIEDIGKNYNMTSFSKLYMPIQQQNYRGFLWYYREVIYYGHFSNGKKDHTGIEIDIKNGIIWKGTFQKGTKTGYFDINYIKDQKKYYGMLKNGSYHGQGNLITKHSNYVGIFKANKKQGYGQQEFKTQQKTQKIYKGQYNDDKFQGNGELFIPEPRYYYKGQFKNNQISGKGFQRVDQYQYSGYFLNGKKQGSGTIKYKDGRVYQGKFKNGKFLQKISINLNPQLKKQKEKISKNNQKIYLKIQKRVNKPLQRQLKTERYSIIMPITNKIQKTERLQKYYSKGLDALEEQNQQGTVDLENQQEQQTKNKTNRNELIEKYKISNQLFTPFLYRVNWQ